MRHCIFFCALFLLHTLLSAQERTSSSKPVKFKTATQSQIQDSLHPYDAKVEKGTPIARKEIRSSLDTAVWGALVTGGLMFVLPQGDFKEVTSNAYGYGFHAGVLVNLAQRRNPYRWDRKWTNFYLGMDLSYLTQGGVKEFIINKDAASTTTVSSLIINRFWAADLVGRFEFLPTQFKLFVEASYGGSAFKGTQELGVNAKMNIAPNTEINTEKTYESKDSWLPQYAYGAGFRTGDATLKFEFKIMNHIGSSVTYVDPQSVQSSFTGGSSPYTYSTKKVTTNFLLPQVGMTYLF